MNKRGRQIIDYAKVMEHEIMKDQVDDKLWYEITLNGDDYPGLSVVKTENKIYLYMDGCNVPTQMEAIIRVAREFKTAEGWNEYLRVCLDNLSEEEYDKLFNIYKKLIEISSQSNEEDRATKVVGYCHYLADEYRCGMFGHGDMDYDYTCICKRGAGTECITIIEGKGNLYLDVDTEEANMDGEKINRFCESFPFSKKSKTKLRIDLNKVGDDDTVRQLCSYVKEWLS